MNVAKGFLISSTASSAAHRISAMRFCSSRGGSGNSCTRNVFQLIVGESEPTDISMRPLHEHVDLQKERQKLRQNHLGFARTTMAWAEQMPSNSATASLR